MAQILNRKFIVILFLFILSLIPLFMKLTAIASSHYKSGDSFDPELYKLNSIKKIVTYTDSIYLSNDRSGKMDTAAYVETLYKTIKKRFQLGISYYNVSENWLAFFCGKLFWPHFSAIVIPDDILKHRNGLCSQQTIVFMEALKNKNIMSRSVGLGYREGPGHFLCEVRYFNDWHLYDVSLEPNWESVADHHQSMAYYLKNKDTLFLAYEHRLPKETFIKLTEKVMYGGTNEFPAKKMYFFHLATYLFSYLAPILLLIALLRIYSVNKETANKLPKNFQEKDLKLDH